MKVAMDKHAKFLFVSAAVFNYFAGLVFVFAMPQFASIIGMNKLPIDPLFWHFGGVLVLAFGWGYWRVSCDPRVNRPIIHMGILGKSLVVIAGYVDWVIGNADISYVILISGDAVFAALFIDYLRRNPVEV